ncbi:uncharacterized [Tachysurus ichikawai]
MIPHWGLAETQLEMRKHMRSETQEETSGTSREERRQGAEGNNISEYFSAEAEKEQWAAVTMPKGAG